MTSSGPTETATKSWSGSQKRTASRVAILFGATALTLLYIPILWLAIMSISERPLSGVPWPLSTKWYDELAVETGKWLETLELSLLIAAIVAFGCMIMATIVGRVLPRLR